MKNGHCQWWQLLSGGMRAGGQLLDTSDGWPSRPLLSVVNIPLQYQRGSLGSTSTPEKECNFKDRLFLISQNHFPLRTKGQKETDAATGNTHFVSGDQ